MSLPLILHRFGKDIHDVLVVVHMSTHIERCMEWSEVSYLVAMVPMASFMVLQVQHRPVVPVPISVACNSEQSPQGHGLSLEGEGHHRVNELQELVMIWGASFLMASVFIFTLVLIFLA